MGEFRRHHNVLYFPLARRQTAPHSQANILLVSKHRRYLDCLRSIEGIQIETADSWRDLNAKILFFRPRAVFLDSRLDWAEPLDLIRELSSHEEVPVILMIAQKRQTHLLKSAYQAGISDVVFAPFKREDILESLSVLLKLHIPKLLHK